MRALNVFISLFGTYRTNVGISDQHPALDQKLDDSDIGLNLTYIPQSRIESENGRAVLVTELGGIESLFLAPVVVLLMSDPILAEIPNPAVFIVGLLALLLPRAIGHLRHQQALKKLV